MSFGARIRQTSRWRKTLYQKCPYGPCFRRTAKFYVVTARTVWHRERTVVPYAHGRWHPETAIVRQEGASLENVRLLSTPVASQASLLKLKRELARSKYPNLP